MQSDGVGKAVAAAAVKSANGGGGSASATTTSTSAMPGNSRKRYRCAECGKGFITPSKLQRHTYSHTGQRPFHCEVCGKSFSQSANLKTHIKNTHPDLLYSENLRGMLRPTLDPSSSLVEQVKLMTAQPDDEAELAPAAATAAHTDSPSPQ